ncbi:hypothetical protein BGX24_008784 [Mortierella sp. AD032]|nr:hypothetical protein BGX24_008784 [Mortierella sp. AD032]
MNPNAPPNGVGNTPPDDSSVSSSSSESGPNNGGGVGGGGSGGGSGTSKAAMGALGAVGGLAAIAVMVFGLVLVKRRRRRQVREQRWIDHNYSSPTMSDNKGSGDYSGGGSGGNGYAFNSGVGPGVGAGGAAGLSYLEDQRDGYTAYHGSSEMTSSAAHHIQSAEYIIPLPAPPADNKDDNGDSHKNQQEISKLPSRPARTYQGEFDDPAPWDGQLGYLPTAHVPQLKQQQQQEQDLGFEYIRDYIISSDAHQQQVQDDQLTAPDLNDTSNSNNNRQLSTRASSQFPEDLEYFARLREASWPMPPLTSPASPTQPRLSNLQQPQQATILGTGSSPTQMPFLIPLPRTLSHSGAHQYDSDSGVETGAGASGGGDGDLRRAASPPGQQLAALNTDEGEVDVDGDGVGSTAAAAAAAADQHKMLSMRYGFENV